MRNQYGKHQQSCKMEKKWEVEKKGQFIKGGIKMAMNKNKERYSSK